MLAARVPALINRVYALALLTLTGGPPDVAVRLVALRALALRLTSVVRELVGLVDVSRMEGADAHLAELRRAIAARQCDPLRAAAEAMAALAPPADAAPATEWAAITSDAVQCANNLATTCVEAPAAGSTVIAVAAECADFFRAAALVIGGELPAALTSIPPALDALVTRDPYLRPFLPAVVSRYARYTSLRHDIDQLEGGLAEFARGYDNFGFTVADGGGLRLREWLPGARHVALIGDFNGWDASRHVCARNAFGVWEVVVPAGEGGESPIPAGSAVKLSVTFSDGTVADRVPAWITRAEQPAGQRAFVGVYEPRTAYAWSAPRPPRPVGLKIYEAHVGIASVEGKVASYRHFADHVVPRVAAAGYNALQLMAIMEHAYYGSFGYQVTSFFAASSRFGPSVDLQYLVDTAHRLGLAVILDVVHSHASKNTADGLNMYDGTETAYFHGGARGNHPQWDSRLFNYRSWETLRFLLSNLRWYLEHFNMDGFRFDGVTSMIYSHHGMGRVFTCYDNYFDESVDVDSCVYLMLANALVHALLPAQAITIAEEVSGMPALCRPIEEGGLGFDYRLGMAIPDMWIKLLKEVPDERWDMGAIVHTLTNRRHMERTIGYAESHDQALVGDKTIAFWLMDKEMYTNMTVLGERTAVIDRGLALHKMIRLLTHALSGEGYMNFIGNEFGHPEWLDFPREGNGESYAYARRQWNLVDDTTLWYSRLALFDTEMNALETVHHWLESEQAFVTLAHEEDKIIVFERAGLLFAFNFHPSKSVADYRLGVARPGCYSPALSSDDERFGGLARLAHGTRHLTAPQPWHHHAHSLLVYLPARSALVLEMMKD